ncbi:winged helix DNA-binding domain-containing protein [Glutamicibacter sp. AOP5-A2-18]|uniref:winged helix DNA-binding domain-containing protein n=1 Tax=Glutamicibacter sp. AOP5-A2-18 TaxID=3457656 RepID=UPI004034B0D0
MERERLLAARMRSQKLREPAQSLLGAAEHMLAIQAQDFTAGRYALAQRVASEPNRAQVNELFNDGQLVRSWTMRGTLHICRAQDAKWMVQAARERTLKTAATNLRALQIDSQTIDRASTIVTKLLVEYQRASRATIFAELESHGIPTKNQRGLHVLLVLVQNGLICLGPIPAQAKLIAQDYVLVNRWISDHRVPTDPMHELLLRYLGSHAPATLRGAAWYTGQTLTTMRKAANEVADQLVAVGQDERGEDYLVVAGSATHQELESSGEVELPKRLLGPFDEYYLSTADRHLIADAPMQKAIMPATNGMFNAFWIEQGRATQVWNTNVAPTDTLGAALHQRYLDFKTAN